MQSLSQDIRYGARMLLKRPGFTAIVITTLALGIGANTAMFTVVNSVLLRPLPYDGSDRLVILCERSPKFERMSISYPDFSDWRAQNRIFEEIGAYNFRDYNLTGSGEPERLRTGQVSADLFTALRVHAALGRFFTNEEDKPGAAAVVVLSYELWQRRFGSDPKILNQSVTLNEHPYEVIGVAPKGFSFSRDTELWVPIGQMADEPSLNTRDNHPGLNAVARLKTGVTLEQARAEMDTIAARLEQAYPDSNQTVGALVMPLKESYVHDVRRAFWILLGAIGLVLLIACANVANLLLARATTRRREMAMRAALGASRWRVIRQLLIESLLLALAGGALGLLMAQWGVSLVRTFAGQSIPRTDEIGIDGLVLVFTLTVSVLTGLIFGLAPALQASQTDVQEALKETTRGTTRGRHRLRQVLVVTEVALTLVLLIGAGLLVRSFYRLEQVNPGFDAERVLSFTVLLPLQRYPNEQQWLDFSQQVIERLHALPGVKDVSVTSRVPMSRDDWQSGFSVVGEPPPPPGRGPSMEVSVVDPNYFRTMGIPLLRGRYFTAQDNRSSLSKEQVRDLNLNQRLRAGLKTIIVDEEFARRHWPSEDPLGQQILWSGLRPSDPPLTVVGVVGHVKLYRPGEPVGLVQGYFPFLEMPESVMSFVIKTTLEPAQMIGDIREQVRSVDPDQPIYDVKTLAERRAESVAPQRFNLLLLGLFAGVALTLAFVGIYGVMAYSVVERTREIGVRMALGAQIHDVLKLILRNGIMLALIGIAIGLAASFALTRLMSNLLFAVTPTDGTTFVSIAGFLLIVALLACLIPARRATKVDPMVALRYE